MWKYADDIIILEVQEYGRPSIIQAAVDSLSRQSLSNDVQLNESKCKEVKVCFAKKQRTNNPVHVEENDKPLEEVSSVKTLGLNISNVLKWNGHFLELVKKTSSRLNFLRQLKRSRVAPKEFILFYYTYIQSLLEYACPVFHRVLPAYLDDNLECLQRRALRIIYPTLSYAEALSASGLSTLFEKREKISSKLFVEISTDKELKKHYFCQE